LQVITKAEKEGLPKSMINEVYSLIHKYSLQKQRKTSKGKKVFGIQGGKGSFNEQALDDYVKRNKINNYKVSYLYTTEKVLGALHRGEIDFGQFAIENSVGGLVDESLQAMAKYKFKIIEEFGITISHFLMKRKDVDISKVDTIMSHPQVLKQCKSTLAKKYSHLKQTSGDGDLIDHAVVAKKMCEKKLPKNIAVMGPRILSDIYDFDIIEGDLQDNGRNLTKFLIVSNE
ncbi:prephenate dehydratase domain-containing protein, partial [Patescibacteria group bacterium]